MGKPRPLSTHVQLQRLFWHSLTTWASSSQLRVIARKPDQALMKGQRPLVAVYSCCFCLGACLPSGHTACGDRNCKPD